MTTRQGLEVAVRVAFIATAVGVIVDNVPLPTVYAQVGASTDAAPAAPPSEPVGVPFTLYAADEGALEYTDLGTPVPLAAGAAAGPIEVGDYVAATRETQASVDDTLSWADLHNGPDVHEAWSVYTDQAVAEAELRRAEYEAGLAGTSTLGVL